MYNILALQQLNNSAEAGTQVITTITVIPAMVISLISNYRDNHASSYNDVRLTLG
ncbi:class III lanthipeptide [Bacillus velezensis]|uniref:class III lanthipeptide n=1 Tax=Bacillus TaxID=1386 RepID=UPI0018E3261B|nr:class III lanthipeptide [Bacillus velezensis]